MNQLTVQPKTWRKVKLGDICRIKTGKTDTQDAVEDGVYPLFDRSITIKRSDKFLFDTSAIILPGEGQEFAPRFYEGKFDLHQRVYAIFCDKEKSCDNLSLKFLYYFLSLNREYFAQTATGATVKSLRLPIIADCAVVLPPFPTQKQIASVLSTYDDLIENNTKRIKVLEEMAQAIYKEWFVYFRFPGHEKVKMIDSKTEFGKIPEGWKIKNLGQVSENYDSKRRPISKMKREEIRGDIPYYGAAKIIDYVNNHIFDGKYLLIAEDGSVITKSGNPVLQFVNEKFWANNHTHILRGREVTTEYLYLSLIQFPIQGYITGVAQPKINQDNLNRIPILVPENEIAQKFDGLVESTFEDAWKLKEIVIKLSKARDLLLPKLVNGEIEVR